MKKRITKTVATKKTKYAKYKAIKSIAAEEIEKIEKKTSDLKLLSEDLVRNLNYKIDGEIKSANKDKENSKNLAIKRVDPILSELTTIRDNLDATFKEKYDKNFRKYFKDDDAIKKSLENFMKGNVNENSKAVTSFLGTLSQIIAQQDQSREVQINNIHNDASFLKAKKVVKNPLWKILHKLTPKHKSSKQVAQEIKNKKALFSRSGDTTDKTKKPKVKFFDKMRHGKSEKGTGKGFGKK